MQLLLSLIAASFLLISSVSAQQSCTIVRDCPMCAAAHSDKPVCIVCPDPAGRPTSQEFCVPAPRDDPSIFCCVSDIQPA
ncbi:unnamed protein product [Cercospora beticola]|nr:unnamed protein product [Cercospora beticola]